MNKFVLILALLIAIPILAFLALIKGPQIYTAAEYYPNRERSCAQRADPVRAIVSDVNLNIPADYFLGVQSHCEGWIPSNCTDTQREKEFKDGAGKVVRGFCQSESDAPFVGKVNLNFDRGGNKGLPLHLNAPGLPEKDFILHELNFVETKKWVSENYCRYRNVPPNSGKKNSDFTDEVYDYVEYNPEKKKTFPMTSSVHWSGLTSQNATFFDNPVTIYCVYTDDQGRKFTDGNKCHITAYMSPDVSISQNRTFSDVELPPEYWTSYIKETEKLVKSMLPPDDKASYKINCPSKD